MNKDSEQFKELVGSFVPINGLAPRYQNEIINQSEIVTYKRRQFVFRQGDRDNYSFYLLDGTLDLLADEQLVKQVSGGTDAARYAMAQLQPRQLGAKAKTSVAILRVDRSLLDRLLTVDDVRQRGEVEVSDIDTEESVDWMTRLLQSELFARIPPANIQRIFTTMESVKVSAGDEIVTQGVSGDYYYFIKRGRCEVLRIASLGAEPFKLAELSEGDGFGEEALVADAVRNASVIMLTDGVLMRLTKEDFVDLIKKPVLNSVSYAEAERLIARGASWVDVRLDEEHLETGITDSINIPIRSLRSKFADLDRGTHYVTYCDTGGRSSVAAFLLTQNGFEASYVSGGLMNSSMGLEVKSTHGTFSGTALPKRASPKKQSDKSNKISNDAQRIENVAGEVSPLSESDNVVTASVRIGADALEADIRASALDAELARANLQIEDALKQKREAQETTKRCEQEAQRSVEKQRARLEAQAAKLREEASQAKRKMFEAAQGKIQQEREKLEAQSQRLKMETEIAIREVESAAQKTIELEREKFVVHTVHANQMLEEAQRLKQELEAAKKQADEEASRRRAEEEAAIEEMKTRSQERLRLESRKLEEEYARNADELARLKRIREDEEEKLRIERSQIDKQVIEARKKLEEARKLKQETEASRRAIEIDLVTKQEERELMERRVREEINQKIRDERLKLESEFARQSAALQRMQAEREAADAARHAAQHEAQRIIEEYKKEYEKSLEEKIAREKEIEAKEEHIRNERQRLEREQTVVEATLAEARHAKDEADRTRIVVERRAKAFHAMEAELRQSTEVDDENHLHAEIAAIEAEMKQATQQLEQAKEVQRVAEAAAKENEETMSRQKVEEDALRRRLAAEAADWRQEHIGHDSETENAPRLVPAKDQLERIKRRAAEAKRQAEDANLELFDDIADQLNQ